MADFNKDQGDVQGVGPNTAAPRESGTPTTGFTEAPVYDGDAADATQGPGIPANRRVIH